MGHEEGKIVARANMDGWIQIDMMNYYQVQVAEGMDACLVLACVCANADFLSFALLLKYETCSPIQIYH